MTVACDSTGHFYAGIDYNGLGVTTGGLSVSSDGGVTWSALKLATAGVDSIVTSGGKVFAGTDSVDGGGGVYVSSDYGSTFTRATNGFGVTGPINSITVTNRGLFASTNGVYHSVDNGTSWSVLPNLLVDRAVHAMVTTSNGDIYVAARNEGVSRSKDHGQTWTVINSGLDGNLNVALLALNSAGEVVGCPSRTIGRSVRLPGNGSTWVQSDMRYACLGLGMDKQKNLIAVQGTGNGIDAYRSTDGGTHFTYLSHVVRGWGLTGAITAAGDVYAGTEAAGGFTSSDSGTTWVSMGATPNNTGFGFAPNGIPFFINTDAHVMQYKGGTTWAISDTGTSYGFSGSSFYTDHSGHFFMNGSKGLCWVSVDNGNTWTAYQTGLPVTTYRARGLSMDRQGYLYMGYDGDLGLYRTTGVVGLP